VSGLEKPLELSGFEFALLLELLELDPHAESASTSTQVAALKTTVLIERIEICLLTSLMTALLGALIGALIGRSWGSRHPGARHPTS